MIGVPWIGVDLDGTLAQYDGWKGVDHIGEPVPAMLKRVKDWLTFGHTVKIFTARVSPRTSDFYTRVKSREAITLWLLKHGLPDLEVVSEKDLNMTELWDDRCVQVLPNTGHPLRNANVDVNLLAQFADKIRSMGTRIRELEKQLEAPAKPEPLTNEIIWTWFEVRGRTMSKTLMVPTYRSECGLPVLTPYALELIEKTQQEIWIAEGPEFPSAAVEK